MSTFLKSEALFDTDRGHRVNPEREQRRIIIIDRCPLFCEGLSQALDQAGFEVVAVEHDLKNVRLSDHGSDSELMIIIACSEDFDAGVLALQSARARFPGSVLVSLCQDCRPGQAAHLLRAGASAILPVPEDIDDFAGVLRLVATGQRVVPIHLFSLCLGKEEDGSIERLDAMNISSMDAHLGTASNRLSSREIEILRCLLAGESNRLIARRLVIGEATVKVHVKAILRKIKVKNRTQAAIWAISNMSPFEHQSVHSTS